MFERTMIYETYWPSHNQYGEEELEGYFTNIYLSFDKEKKCIIVEQINIIGIADDKYNLEEVIEKRTKKTEISIDPL